MNEEEKSLISKIERFLNKNNDVIVTNEDIIGLLNTIDKYMDLYNKEKEKNKEILSNNVESFQKYFLEEFALHFVPYEHYVSKINEVEAKWKNKIKAKIEEVKQYQLHNMKIPKLSTLDERLGAKIGIKYVLQSLLGKE